MKGSAYAWIVVLLIIFVGSFLWIIFSEVLVPHVFPEAETQLSGYTEATSILDNIKSVWNNWPLILIIGIIIYGIVSSLKREPDTYYGYG